MVNALFLIAFVAELLLAGSLLYSIQRPAARIWPPPGKSSWQFWWVWTLTLIATVGIVAVAVLDWDTFVFAHWLRYPVGAALCVGGTGFALWGVATLSPRTSTGLRGRLVAQGPYRYSRNPQYVGDIGLLLGIAVVSNSMLVLVLAVLGIACFYLSPFIEEPWLREQYGDAYEEYRKSVPRFIGLRRQARPEEP